MAGKLVTLIVPIYNVEVYIERCLNSILKQTYKNIQIILVNDGTKDDSMKIAQKMADMDDRIEIYNKENGGLSDARNFGLKYAKGEFICFVDSDDWLDENFIMRLLKQFEADDEIDISLVEFEYNYDEGSKCREFKMNNMIIEHDRALYLLCKGNEITNHVWNKMYKKFLFDDIRFDVGRKFEDIFIMHKLFSLAKKVSYDSYVGYHYYMRNDSILHEHNNQNDMDIFIGYKNRYEFLNNAKQRKEVLKYCAWSCYKVLFLNKNNGVRQDELIHAEKFWNEHKEIARLGLKYACMYKTPYLLKIIKKWK